MSASPERPPVTRLAPSPTGALHLGNARTFVLNWLLARRRGWRVILRIEDLDTPRTKRGADQQALDDLRWLGVDWDEGPYHQANDLAPYHAALAELAHQGRIYPCTCSRREIELAQSAPHEGDAEPRYPGVCRPKDVSAFTWSPRDATAWRVIVPDEPVTFTDELRGPQSINVQTSVGDFLVATKAQLPAYQLAVVVDDARQGVTDVVRGDDLLDSTARQIWLHRWLTGQDGPRWWHLPLVRGQDGRRLAKRHGDTRLATYRQIGVPARRVLGLIAFWSGLRAAREPCTLQDLLAHLDISQLPGEDVIFTPEDHAWLLGR